LVAAGLTVSSFVDTNAANGQTNYYKVAAADACGAGAYSQAVGVLLPLPVLGLSMSANALAISWPGWATDWGLYGATNLTPPVAWTPVTSPVVSNSGQFKVTVTNDSPVRFFRLSSP
jgi:hypothetical protein